MRRGWSGPLATILACVALAAEGRAIRGRLIGPDGIGLAAITVTALPIDGSECCGKSAVTASDGSFSIEVDPAVYVVWTTTRPPFKTVGSRVDTSAGDVNALELVPGTGRPAFIADEPPRASLIGVSTDGGDFATFRGSAGAVPPRSFVMLTTLETGDFSATEAGADGRFEARHFAPPGASVMIQTDPLGLVLSRARFEVAVNGGESALAGTSGTILRVPLAESSGTFVVGGTGVFSCCQSRQLATFSFKGALNALRLSHGDALRLQGTIRSESPAWQNVESLTQAANLQIELLSDASGDTRSRQAIFSSTLLTPTGLAIERNVLFGDGPAAVKTLLLTKKGTNTLEAEVDLTLTIPNDLPRGRYRAVLALCCETGSEKVANDRSKLIVDRVTVQRRSTVGLAIVELGDPPVPQMHWTLLVDDSSGGARGVIALEDRGRYAVASRIVTESDAGVVPRTDERTGQPIAYRLEPFALTVSVGDRGVTPSVPAISFRFPSGSLRVEIRAPDGSLRRLGPYPFVQSRSRTVATREGKTLDEGGGHLTDAYQLSTMRPELEVRFDTDGEHVITLEGEIEDIWGHVWRGRGTYPLLVAKQLVLDPAALPGTPFEVGDSLTPGLTVIPPVAADIEMRLRFVPRSDSSRTIERIYRGRANRTGYFHTSPFTFSEPGEYRVDVTAKYRDEAGALWAGAKTCGGVVAPVQASLIAHGRRGTDGQTDRQQWFARRSDFSHLHFPFATGDVAWQTKNDSTFPVVTVQDPTNRVTNLLRSRAQTARPGLGAPFDERAAIGEIPLFSSRSDLRDPYLDPALVDLWAYGYRSVQRPLVRVREVIGEEMNGLYWRFNESYADQPGVGSGGDLPNDFKFQFGGAVVRGPAIGEPEYAIYGSLFVLIPDSDPIGSRVFPPFQGNGGGTSGGPLFKLKGRDIDIFLHPTGVRPGTILQLGDSAAFAGQIGPPLPSKVEFVVTAPSGAVRTVSGQANKIGYFYQPSADFRVDEAGVWRARVRVWHDGLTSAGQVQAPFPTGDVLGSRDGEFYFYVVDRTSPPLGVLPSPASRFVRPADGPISFTITPPAGLTNLEMHYTVTMPGFVLAEGRTSVLRYIYDARSLNSVFPNLDLIDREGFAGVDIITLSLLVSGTDSSGKTKYLARQIVLQGEELQMPEQNPLPATPRRRSVGR